MENPPPTTSNPREVSSYLNRLELRLAEIDHALFLAWWNQYAGVSLEGTAPWDSARSKLVGREKVLRFLRRAQSRSNPPLLTRRLELFRRIAEDALVEQHPSVARLRARLVQRIFAFRPKWKGKPATEAHVRDVLRLHKDRRIRRRAYEALQRVAVGCESDLRSLVQARNTRAQALGYRSFMDFRLQAEGLTLQQLEGFIDRIIPAARSSLRRFRDQFQQRSRDSGFYPWDTDRAAEGRNPLPEAAFAGSSMVRDSLRTIRAWGFRGPGRPFTIVQRSIPVGGITLAVQLPTDTRVAVNPKGGWLHYSILLHEFGHAVQSQYTRGSTHVLRGPENIPGYAGFHEGIGGLFEKIPTTEAWLRARPRVDPALVLQFRDNMKDEELRGGAVTANWVRKEIQLYKRPTANLSPDFERFDRATYGFDVHPASSFADPFWVDAAFYSKSYLIASILGAQLRQAIREQVPGPFWPNRGVIPWLGRNWFRFGARYDWVPRVREVTGRPFGVRDFLDRTRREA
ncbi:MAG: M3 family metallopeptidase [Thermoplasmata archaeon]|nr:M3 family metallopeptidase [Thermoplasmata archaeon]